MKGVHAYIPKARANERALPFASADPITPPPEIAEEHLRMTTASPSCSPSVWLLSPAAYRRHFLFALVGVRSLYPPTCKVVTLDSSSAACLSLLVYH
eukprot:5629614-Pyramimonas_sp.AAC.2